MQIHPLIPQKLYPRITAPKETTASPHSFTKPSLLAYNHTIPPSFFALTTAFHPPRPAAAASLLPARCFPALRSGPYGEPVRGVINSPVLGLRLLQPEDNVALISQ